MSETNGKIEVCPTVRIVIEYDRATGKYELSCNVRDEVITIGMLNRALEVFKTEYRMAEMRELKQKVESEIVTAPVGLTVL